MGALPIIGDISSGVGALTGIYSAAEGADYNAQMLALQQQENEKNRQFQSQEAEKERAFSSVQMNQLLDYNSASKQVQRLREAGINPATSFSNGAGSAGSAMSPTRGAVPVGSSGLQIPSFISPMAEISASGAYLKSLADAYKASEEGSKARDLLQSEIEKNMSERNLKDLYAEGQQTANMIAFKTGMRKAEAEIKYILNDADLKIAQKAESIAKKGLTEAETNRQIEQLTGDVYDNVRKQFEALLGKKRYQMAEIDLRYHEAEVREGIRTLQSQQAKNFSDAELAQKNSEYQKMVNDVYDLVEHDGSVTEATRRAILNQLRADARLADKDVEQVNRYLETMSHMRKNRALRALDNMFSYIDGKLNISVGTGSKKAAKFVK